MTKQSFKYRLCGIMHKLDANYCQTNAECAEAFTDQGEVDVGSLRHKVKTQTEWLCHLPSLQLPHLLPAAALLDQLATTTSRATVPHLKLHKTSSRYYLAAVRRPKILKSKAVTTKTQSNFASPCKLIFFKTTTKFFFIYIYKV